MARTTAVFGSEIGLALDGLSRVKTSLLRARRIEAFGGSHVQHVPSISSTGIRHALG
jgi:hypothetical protein